MCLGIRREPFTMPNGSTVLIAWCAACDGPPRCEQCGAFVKWRTVKRCPNGHWLLGSPSVLRRAWRWLRRSIADLVTTV